MVLANDVVTEILQQPCERIADDGAAQVADVHFLGEVGRRVIDHHGLWTLGAALWLRDVEPLSRDGRGQKFWRQMNVDETRPGDFHLVGDAGQIEVIDNGLRQLARRLFHGLGACHRTVRLVVSESFAACRSDAGAKIFRNARPDHGGVNTFGE